MGLQRVVHVSITDWSESSCYPNGNRQSTKLKVLPSPAKAGPLSPLVRQGKLQGMFGIASTLFLSSNDRHSVSLSYLLAVPTAEHLDLESRSSVACLLCSLTLRWARLRTCLRPREPGPRVTESKSVSQEPGSAGHTACREQGPGRQRPCKEIVFVENLMRIAALTQPNVIHCHFDVLMINVINNQQSIYSSCKYILTFRLLFGYSNSQNVEGDGRRHARALLLHTLNAKYNTCQFLEVHYIHQLAGYAMGWELRQAAVLAALIRSTPK